MQNREIKFRAWDKVLGCIVHPQNVMLIEEKFSITRYTKDYIGNVGDSIETIENPKEFDIMQYTGLKDKEGKEIYEGDLVEYGISKMVGHNKRKEMGLVIWENDGAYFRIKNLDSDMGISFSSYFDQLWTKIIGNIYENPELIDK